MLATVKMRRQKGRAVANEGLFRRVGDIVDIKVNGAVQKG